MKHFLILDSHALIHRFFHALPPLTSPSGDPVNVIYGMANVVLRIYREIKPEYLAAAFDRPEKTFREEMSKDYKAHRPPTAPDLISQFAGVHTLLDQFGIATVEAPGYEADDLIGALVARFSNEPDLRISILTGDLDLLQLVRGERVTVSFLQKGMSETKIYDEAAVRERYGLSPRAAAGLEGAFG